MMNQFDKPENTPAPVPVRVIGCGMIAREILAVTEQLGLQKLEARRKNSRLNTLMKVLGYEHLHPVLIDYFNNLNLS